MFLDTGVLGALDNVRRRWEYLLPVVSMLPDRSLVPSTSTLLPMQLNSTDSQTQSSEAATVMQEGQWTYQVSAKLSARFDLRAWPAPKASKTGFFVHQGEVLSVDARLVLDGILFLHVATAAPDLAQQADCRAQTESANERSFDCKGATRTQSAVCSGWIFDRTQGGGSGICSAPGDRVLLSELPGGNAYRTKLVGGSQTSHCCADPVAVARSDPSIPCAVSCLLRLVSTSLQTHLMRCARAGRWSGSTRRCCLSVPLPRDVFTTTCGTYILASWRRIVRVNLQQPGDCRSVDVWTNHLHTSTHVWTRVVAQSHADRCSFSCLLRENCSLLIRSAE